ncbi:hypothetical protein NL393_30390, partial [Klebsiella pneumoniae]|nr:hypothetical protein [Klebsiella pneumoniae]
LGLLASPYPYLAPAGVLGLAGALVLYRKPAWGLLAIAALVPLEGLPANSPVHYEVFVDERRVWPPEGRRAAIHTVDAEGPVTLAFGSCRRGDNYSDESLKEIGADALAGLGNALIEED